LNTVRKVEDRDLIQLAEFLPKGFTDTTKEFWLPLFEMWWKLNPAFTEQFPRGWIIEENNVIIGFLGNIPTKFLIRGEMKIAAASNSWYVDPSVRGLLSLRLFNEFMKQKNVDLYLFKAEDESLRDIMFKYKFEEYILPLSQKEYFFIIDKKKVKSIFKLYFLNNQMPKLSQLSEYFKRLGYLFFTYLYQKPVIRGVGLEEEIYISSLCTSCDDTFYNLWKPKLNFCDATLSRDTKTLNWLYFSSARQYKRMVIQCHRTLDKTLAGYMVFDLILTEGSEVGSMQLVDMCIENNDQQVMASLTSYAIKLGKENNAALIILWANSPEAETYFRSTIPMRSTVQHYRYIRFSNTHKIESGRDNYDKVCMSDIYPPQ
jgi:hypothetical protein